MITELREIHLPLVAPFQTSFGVQTSRRILLVRALVDGTEGWGECVAPDEPTYSAEYVDGAWAVSVDHLLPRLGGVERATEVGRRDGVPRRRAACRWDVVRRPPRLDP